MVDEVIVIKFGGSCLSDPRNILIAANKVSAEIAKNQGIVVVVSAMKGATDGLLSLAQDSTLNKVTKEDLDEILSMGERTTVRLMSTALKSIGLNPVPLDPSSSMWSIHTDSNFGNAEVDLKKTEKATREVIRPLLNDEKIPVIAGFLGLSPRGKVTTLGRGGSDISAVVLGRCLNAKEVIFGKNNL